MISRWLNELDNEYHDREILILRGEEARKELESYTPIKWTYITESELQKPVRWDD